MILGDWKLGSTHARYGQMAFLAHDAPIGRSLSQYGEWAQYEINLLTSLIKDGDTVVDVGANVGTHTLAFSSKVGTGGRVISFEPQNDIYDILVHNIGANAADNVNAMRCGAGRRHETLHITPLDYSVSGNYGAISLADDKKGELEVAITPLDHLSLQNCALIKIDAEGMEGDVIDGARTTIERCRPYIYCEANDCLSAVTTMSTLKTLGYYFYHTQTPAYNPNNHKKNSHNFFGLAAESNLLCSPVTNPSLPELPDVKIRLINNFDDLADAVLSTPRFGDTNSYARDRVELLRRLNLSNFRIKALQIRLGSRDPELSSRLSLVEQELAILKRSRAIKLASFIRKTFGWR